MSDMQSETLPASSWDEAPTAFLIEWLRVCLFMRRQAGEPLDSRELAEMRSQLGRVIRELVARGIEISPEFRQKRVEFSDDIEPTGRRGRQRQPPPKALGSKPPATRIMYVECKSHRNDRGRARICRVRFSKSGRTIYLGGLILESCRGAGVAGNYIDVNNGLEYWVSGPKKKGGDRHWAGGGEVRIEADVVDEYWRDIRGCKPPANPFLA